MRLGDNVEDYCTRCKLSLEHSIVAMHGEEVLQVRCRTCNSEHKYRRNRGGKKQLTAQEAFNKVLASVTAAQDSGSAKKK
jgi:hypothetical protein